MQKVLGEVERQRMQRFIVWMSALNIIREFLKKSEHSSKVVTDFCRKQKRISLNWKGRVPMIKLVSITKWSSSDMMISFWRFLVATTSGISTPAASSASLLNLTSALPTQIPRSVIVTVTTMSL